MDSLCSEEISDKKSSFINNSLEALSETDKNSSIVDYLSQVHSSSASILLPLIAKSQLFEDLIARLHRNESLNTDSVLHANSIINSIQSPSLLTTEDISSERFLPLASIIINTLKNLNQLQIEKLKSELNGQGGLHEAENAWTILEGTHFLSFSTKMEDLPDDPQPISSSLNMCPTTTNDLQDEEYVSIKPCH